ncbi:MAG: metallopeptidase family protein [Oligoflexia bacterium]|nr:metallopeptidase family protein [Oligoflexia bacterium]
MTPSRRRANRSRFDRLLQRVLDGLPPEIHELLESVPLIVEDEPSASVRREMGLPGGEPSDLCGAHWGMPLSAQSVAELTTEPERILLFRGPITRMAGESDDELARQILVTLLHEIGHHFGMTEEDLEDLGYG